MPKFPVIILVVAFTTGLLFQFLFPINTSTYILTLLILIVFIFVSYYFVKRSLFLQIFLVLAISCIGALYLTMKQENEPFYPFEVPKIRNAKIIATIEKIDLLKKNKISTEINIISVNNKEFENSISSKFLCNMWKDTTRSLELIYTNLEIGNTISFIGTIKKARDQRNPGEFNYEKYLLQKGISGIISCYKIESLKIINTEEDYISNLIFDIRKNIYARINTLFNEKSSALIKGIILADRSDINYEIKKTFINTGVIHVLAVSGLHVGFITLLFFLIFGRFDLRIDYGLTILGIICFLIITGGHPSVFRASTMAVVYLLAKLTGRSTNGFNSISIAALIILLINPNELLNPGFLLSFSAVISILIIYPILSEKIANLQINGLVKKILLFMSVSFAAQIGTLPFTLVYFNKLSLVSLFANLIVIPIIGFVVAISLLSLVISVVSIWAASMIASANMMLIDLLFYFVQNVSELSFSFIPIYNFSIYDGIIFYTFLAIILFAVVKFKKRLSLVVLIIFSLLSMQHFFSFDNSPLLGNSELSIIYIDVGQGDSFLIKFPNSKTALIDAGNATEYFDNGERIILPLLQRLGIKKVDYAFVSHLDSDHYAGFISLINQNIISKVYKPKVQKSVKDSIFEDYLTANKIQYDYYSNASINIGNCKIYFLNDTSYAEYNNFDSNNKSGIIKIVYGSTSFLFVGDAEKEAEQFMIKRYFTFLKADVLKVGHHGSNTSSSNLFLDMVKPSIGIISAGVMNKFSHPSKKVLSKFKKRNIKIRRTDLEGAIILSSDGYVVRNIDWRNL